MADRAPRLSTRQREVLEHAARGRTERETAQALGVSKWTVDTHTRRAFARLNARSMAQAVAIAILLGLIFCDSTDFPRLPN
jgi:DNA-binding CsgD family transcriptional regulator